MLKEEVLKTIKKYNMLNPGDRVLAGVSGGPDSVALLLVLHELSKELNLKLFAACLNHMFRKKEAEEDVRFVQKIAGKLNIPFFSESINVPEIQKRKGGSKEDVARQLRYEFFAKVAKKFGANKIALGHTMDDQAETVLMRLLWGAGLAGLGGIPPVRRLGRHQLIRPLIEASREEIIRLLRMRRIKARIDSSNLKDTYKRNKIRLRLIPHLQSQYNPKIKEALNRLAETARDDYHLLRGEVLKKAFRRFIKETQKGEKAVSLRQLQRLHRGLQKYLLRQLITLTKGDTKRIEYRHWQALKDFIKNNKDKKIMHLPGGCRCRIDADKLIFYMGKTQKIKTSQYEPLLALNVPGKLKIPKTKIKIQTALTSKRPRDAQIRSNPKIKYLDYSSIKSLPLYVRFRRQGDKFRPLGMDVTKKLKDFFIDKKIPAAKRDKIPLLLCGNEIVCVGDIEISDKVKIRPNTKKILKLQF